MLAPNIKKPKPGLQQQPVSSSLGSQPPGGGITPYGGTPPATPIPTPTIPLVSSTPPPPGTQGPGVGTQGVGTQTDPSVLGKFGYQGEIGINPQEQQALDFMNEMYGGRGDQPLQSAKNLYESILAGEFGPQGQQFQQDVYGATKTGAMQNLADMQDMMAERFSHRGGYFGGKHGVAQSDLARKTGSGLDQLLAGLNMQGFQQDIGSRLGAAGGLQGLAGTERGLESSLLQDMMGGGQMVTGRELTNRDLYQQASDRAYQDWVRSRQEQMMPFGMMGGMLNMQPYQNVAFAPEQSPWNALLGGAGQGAGAVGTSALLGG